jgi:elongation factor Ts
MIIDVLAIKKLREATGAGIADCRQALEETGGEQKKAVEWLKKRGIEKAGKKEGREVKAGAVFSYVHHNQALGSLVTVATETSFAARTDDFQKLGHELAMQAAATSAKSPEELLKQEYIRDPSKTVQDLVKEVSGKVGENIKVTDVVGTAVNK